MVTGYASTLFIMIGIILLITGWRTHFFPGIGKYTFWCFLILFGILCKLPLWFKPIPDYDGLQIHVASILLLIACSVGLFMGKRETAIGYEVLCLLMLTLVWTSLRSLYAHDPLFHWVSPEMDAPLLCGILSSAFASSYRQQFTQLIWGSTLASMLLALQQHSGTLIGSVNWWDELCTAVAAGILCSVGVKMWQRILSWLNGALFYKNRGSS
ncbi:YphA family membrane protein [Paenibacillus chungangensis]|uniref:Uncharacterized protein n=1 Tax=Paenibacillus chungangensis TaxID=696535 RepID=A0ABW3HMT4_9BACL